MIRDVYLYGTAGTIFGRHFRIDIASPAEAVRALCCLRPGLRQALRAGAWRVIVGTPHLSNGIAAQHLGLRLGSQPLHIVPTTRPAGGDGATIGKIIVGAVLIAAAIALPAFGMLGALAAGGVLGSVGISYGTIALIGVSMVALGVTGLLTQPPAQNASAATDRTPGGDAPSFLFGGVTNNSQAGGPVPIVVGTHLVGSVVVSAGLETEDVVVS